MTVKKGKAAVKRSSRPLRMRRKPGRPAWCPTDDERRMVQACMASGDFTQEAIAAALGVDHETLVKHCKAELTDGRQSLNAKVSATLAKKALDGDMTAIIWYEKTRRGYRDTSRHELTGADGGPIDSRNATLLVEITPEMDAGQASEVYKKLLG